MTFYLASVGLLITMSAAYSIVTQRWLRAAGKPASWLLALTLGVLIALTTILTPHASITDFAIPCHGISLLAASLLPFLGAATGFALTAREGRSRRAQLGAALALGSTASLAAPGVALLLVYLLPGNCA